MTSAFAVLYTHQKTKKHKTWQDGILTLSKDGKTGYLKNDEWKNISTVSLKKEVNVGDELQSAKYLVQIDEVCAADHKVKDVVSEENIPCSKTPEEAVRRKKLVTKSGLKRSFDGEEKLTNLPKAEPSEGKALNGSTDHSSAAVDLENTEPSQTNGIKRRKKFCVPRLAGKAVSIQGSIYHSNADPEDEFSGITCTVVRQGPGGVWQMTNHNQPQDGTSDQALQDDANVARGSELEQREDISNNPPTQSGVRAVSSAVDTVTMKTTDQEKTESEGRKFKAIRTGKDILDIIKRAKNKNVGKCDKMNNLLGHKTDEKSEKTLLNLSESNSISSLEVNKGSKISIQNSGPVLLNEESPAMRFGLLLEHEQPLFSIADDSQDFVPDFALM